MHFSRDLSETNESRWQMCKLQAALPEIAIILVAGLFVLGPEKVSELVRASGQMAGEFKDEL
jgi:mttA/Hcf106 family